MDIFEVADNNDQTLLNNLKTADGIEVKIDEIFLGKTYESAGFFEGVLNAKTNIMWVSHLKCRVSNIFKHEAVIDLQNENINSHLPLRFVALKISVKGNNFEKNVRYFSKIVLVDNFEFSLSNFIVEEIKKTDCKHVLNKNVII